MVYSLYFILIYFLWLLKTISSGIDPAKESNVRLILCFVPAYISLNILSWAPAGLGKLLNDTVVFGVPIYKDLTFQ